jgi:RNA polymerase sigma-70 factor (ECF subfamily)
MTMEAETFEQVVAQYGARLRARIARQNAGFGFDEDEAMQECLIRIWRACRNDREVDSPAAYAEQLVASVMVDLARRRASQRSEPLEDVHESPQAGPATLSEQAQEVDRVLAALSALDARRRDAASLLLQGHGCAEIAVRLGLTEAAARNLAYRGLNDLRERLAATAGAAA